MSFYMYVDLRACKPPFSESNRMAFPPSALPEYLEGRTPKEKRSMHFCLAGGECVLKKERAFFFRGCRRTRRRAAAVRIGTESERTKESQASTRSARAKWVRAKANTSPHL